ncbi:MAG: F0F1 ATP synthase subunit A [Christensenellales bacterium]|jgi:F-type H+-transporting ATPase subunit a
MSIGQIVRWAVIAASLALGIFQIIRWRRSEAPSPDDPNFKKARRKRRLTLMTGVFGLWLCCGLILGMFAGPSQELHIDIMAPRMNLWGMDVSSSVVISWIAMAILIILAVIIRLFVIPKFSENPKGLQSTLEIMVEGIADYTESRAPHLGENLGAYIFAVAALLVACSALELFGLRPPTADLIMTASLAICTFVLINYYGIKQKGVKGRIKSFAEPTPAVFPIKVLSDIAIPVSLACRLFGNMLGGMIVVHLLYMALGAFGVGIPAVLGLYFNVFHPLIQAFIFITLTLTFINEAVE